MVTNNNQKIKALLFLLPMLLLLFAAKPLFAQKGIEKLIIDNFDSKTKKSQTHNWNAEGRRTIIKIVSDSNSKNQLLQLSYNFKKEKDEWNFAAMSCPINPSQFLNYEIISVAYAFRGNAHSLAYRTSSVVDNYFFKKEVPESKKWTDVVIPIKSLIQSYNAVKIPLNYLDLTALAWQVWGHPNDSGTIFIDNVHFIVKKNATVSSLNTFPNQSINYYKEDSITTKIINPINDSLNNNLKEYHSKANVYKKSIKMIRQFENQTDSIILQIKNSVISEKKKRELIATLLFMFNSQQKEEIQNNKIVNQTKLFALVSTYKKQLDTITFINSWAKEIWNFSLTKAQDTLTKSNAKIQHELSIYNIQKGEKIAEIGAGKGDFIKTISQNYDDLKIFVNEIDTNYSNTFDTKLYFLNLNDDKNISYTSVLGNAKSTNLPHNSFDKIIIRNTFHHFEFPGEMVINLKQILKPDGKLFILEKFIDEIKDPECLLFMTRSKFMNYLNNNGFKLSNETKLLNSNFICLEFIIE